MSEWLTVKIVSRQQEALDIVSFRLVDPAGRPLPTFTAGAHIDVEIDAGLVRQYSLCNAPGDSDYHIAVLKEPASRGGSLAMHDFVADKSIRISKPRNHFPLVAGKRFLLFAGGIGIAPLLSMAEQLSRDGTDFTLHYCARSLDRMAFVSHIRQSSFAARAMLHFDDGAFTQKLAPEKELSQPDSATQIYICGPAGFISWISSSAYSMGWSETQIHREYFSAAQALQSTDEMFEVQIASSGAVYLVEPDQSIANVLRSNGIYVPTSCEQGICGTCLTNVIAGIPDHRDHFLTKEEQAGNTMLMPCCSRSKSPRLVLDL